MNNNLIYCGKCRRLVCGYNAIIHDLNCSTLFLEPEPDQPETSGRPETLQPVQHEREPLQQEQGVQEPLLPSSSQESP